MRCRTGGHGRGSSICERDWRREVCCLALGVVLRSQDTLGLSQIVIHKCLTQIIPSPLLDQPRLLLGYCGSKITVLATSTVFQLHSRIQELEARSS